MSNFQPLSEEARAAIDPFNVASLTGMDGRSGLYIDVDPEHSSLLLQTNNTPALYVDKFQNLGVNTLNPSAQLDVNSSSGSCIQLTYNGSSTNKANMGVTSDGKLVLMAGGSEVNVDTSSNFNIKSHNGANSGLMLGNSLVLSTADQLNFNVVTPGTASNSKALVLNSSGNVAGINSLSATTLIGTLQTAAQPNVRTLDVVDITGHTGVAGLSLGGQLVSSTAEQLNYTNTTPGTAAASKALIFDANRDISNINSLTASQLTGLIQTAAQPNITSVGTLSDLDISGDLTGLTDLSINTTETGRTLVVNDASGNCIRMYYDAATSAANYTDMIVDGSGNMSLTSSGGSVDITSHDGASQGIKLGGILVTATADQVNYLQGTTPGSVTAGKAVVMDSNRSISNINALTATSLTGTIQTAAQPLISSVTALNITSHDGATLGLKLNGSIVSATAAELNYVDTTPGAAEAMKALVLDGSSDISGIHALTASELTGTLQTAAQPNVTSVGTLSSLAIAGDLTVGSTVLSENEVAVLDAVVPGTAAAGKALVLSDSSDVSGINALVATELTGTLQTAAQPNVTSVTTLNITGADGTTAGLELGGSLVTATAVELNYVDTTPGAAAATKALVLDANKDISGINSVSATSFTGTLQTAAQPNVTSVGTLSSLAVAGDVTVGSTTLEEAEVAVLDNVMPGTVSASKALVVDADKNISTLNSLTATSLIATDLTGTLQTAAQPNVTSVTTLDITGANGTDAGLKLGGVLLTATADQINSIFGSGGVGTFENLTVNDSLTLANADGTSKGLVLGETLMTASGDELNYLDGALPGTVVASKAVVVDANKDIASFRNLTATNLTGQIQTADQPLITSLGTVSNLVTSGSITLDGVSLSAVEVGALDGVTAGTASASKAMVLDSSSSITGVGSITANALTLLGTSTSYFPNDSLSIGTSGGLPVAVWVRALFAYSPTLQMAIAVGYNNANSGGRNYAYMTSETGYAGYNAFTGLNGDVNAHSINWQPEFSRFIFYYHTVDSYMSQNMLYYITSTNGFSWTSPVATGVSTYKNCNIAYHTESGRYVFFAKDKFYYSTTGTTGWTTVNTGIQLDTSGQQTQDTVQFIGNYATVKLAASGQSPIMYWDGTAYTLLVISTATFPILRAYSVSEDCLYMTNGTVTAVGTPLAIKYIENISTLAFSDWSAAIQTFTYTTQTIFKTSMQYCENYGVILTGLKYTTDPNWLKTARVLRIENKEVTFDFSDGPTDTPNANYQLSTYSCAFVGWDEALVIPSMNYPTNVHTLYSTPAGGLNGFTFGSTTIGEPEMATIDGVTAGSASASKALILDGSKNISGIGSLSATNLTGQIQTPAQPLITSVGALTSLSLANGGALTLGATAVSEAEIGVLDAVVPGTVAASKAVVVDANKDISSFRNLTATNLTGTLQTAAQPNVATVNALDITTHDGSTVGLKLGGSLVTSTADELNYIDGSVPGTVVPSKAVVVDGNKDISSFRNLTSVTLTATSGSLTMGATTIDEAEIGVLDAVVPGTAAASKAVVLDANKDVSGVHSISANSFTSTDGSLTMGATVIDEAEIGVLDAVVPGTAAVSKALVLNADKDISGINSLSAADLISTAGSLTMGATVIDESEIGVLDAVVPGIVSASKAVVVDENKDISSFRNLTAVNLTGTLQTVAQPLVTSVGTLDDLTVAGDITTNSDLVIAGTTVTGTEAAWLAGATPGAALPTTALVVDGSKDITGINSLTATSLTGTLQTAAQPNVTSVSVLDVTAHDGATQGLKLGGVLLTASAEQINSIFGDGGEGTFTNLTVNDTLTLANADGSSMGLVMGETLVTATGNELNYVDTTPGHAQAWKALVFDANVDIDSINNLTAANLTGTLQTAAQPNVTSVSVLDVTSHDGSTAGLKLGGVLLTATATQINSIFGAGGEGTFNNLTVNDTLTLANADGSEMGLVLGSTLLTASGVELNYLDGSTPGSATAGNALVLDSSKDISGINSLTATTLTGTLQTAAQPNVTSVGTLVSLAVAGSVTVGETVLSESEVRVLDAVVPGTVSASKALVVDANKDISTIRNLTATSLIATDVTGTLQTAAQPNVTSVGELVSLDVAGDVNVGGNLNVGGTFISESEIIALDAATPGHAVALKVMITDADNSIDSINSLTATSLTGTLQTAAQPNVTSVGELTSLAVAGDVNVGGNLNVGGTFISESEIIALDAATPGHAVALKAMITDANNSIDSINSLTATSLTGTLQTAAQPNIATVNALDVTTHDGATLGLKLGGTLVTASASEINYVDTTVGAAQASKALVLDANKDIAEINDMSMHGLTSVIGSITSEDDSSSPSTGALTVAGGAGIAKSLYVGGDSVVSGALVVQNTVSLVGAVSVSNSDESTSESTGSITTAGGVGIAKSLYVAGNSTVVGNVSVTGSSTQAGTATITNATDSTAATNGSLVVNGGVGIAKNLNVGVNTSIGGTFAVAGTSALTGALSVADTTASTSAASGALTVAGGAGVGGALNVGSNASVVGNLAITGTSALTGAVSVSDITDSSSITTGSVVTAGGVGITKQLNVGGITKVSNATASADAASGALVVSGGAGVGGDLNVGGSVGIVGAMTSTGDITTSGAVNSINLNLTTEDGAAYGIAVDAGYVSNQAGTGYQWNSGSTAESAGTQLLQLDSTAFEVSTIEKVSNTTESTTVSTGAITTTGGVGIAKNLNVGGSASVAGDLLITGGVSQSGVFGVANTTDSTSVSTGAITTDGGVGIAKALNVGTNASVGGDIAVAGSATISSAADSTSTSTGSIVTAGGVGIAKALNVGTNATVAGNFVLTGTSALGGDVSVASDTQSTSISTGSIVTAGGVGIAKALNVGETADIAGDVSIGGTTSQAGVVTITDATESTNATDGSLVTAGGVGITKNLNVAGTAMIANATPSTSATTGALVVSGGVGISSDLNIGGDLGVAGDFNLIGDINLSGKLNTTNVSLTPDQSSPFSTAVLTTITHEDTILALNKTAGLGYINSASAVVAVPTLLTKHSIVYYATNGESTWSTLGLTGDAASAYDATYAEYDISIEQVIVSQWSGKIWVAGSLSSGGSSTAVVISGDLDNGMDSLYVVGSSSEDAKCMSIAVATDDNNVAVIHQTGSTGALYFMDIASSPTFASVSSGTFKSVAWLNGLGKFVATRSGASSMYCSTNSSGASWGDATTPSAVAPNTVYFNTTINLAVAVGDNFLWYSTNGVSWTVCTYPALAGGNKFNAVMNSPVSALLAVYSDVANSVPQLYYSIDAINWTAITLTGTFGLTSPKTSSVVVGSSNYAYAISTLETADIIQKIGPITSASMIYGVGVTSGYLKNESATGYQWYNNSTPTDVGTQLMDLTTSELTITPIVEIINSTNSTSTSTGALVTAGGVGIAKSINVGMNAYVGGDVAIAGSLSQAGLLNVIDNTDATSTSTGAIITAGGVGIAKSLKVGASAAISGALEVTGASTLTGSVVIDSTTETLSPSTGSLTTAGGVGIAKSLQVGVDARIGGNMTIDGSTTQTGVLSVPNSTDASSVSTGAITTTGGVGIAKKLYVGGSTHLTGVLNALGASNFTGITSVVNSTDATSAADGALQVAGGVGIAKALFVGSGASVAGALAVTGSTTLTGSVSLASATDSVSVSTGSFVTAGGVGIAKALNVGTNASILGDFNVAGLTAVSNDTDSTTLTTGSITTAGGVGIAKTLRVGTGIYGTLMTAAQPNISSVTVLNVTGANATDAGLSLNGELITATAPELNYLDGSTPGVAVAGKALVFDLNRSISNIQDLTADTLTGEIQTASQPLITSVSTLNITAHDGLESGLQLGGTLLLATAAQLNSLVAGTSASTFDSATVSNNLTLSGANGVDTGLILGSTLVTATGTELNYVDTTPGSAEASKALVLNADSDISGIHALTATELTGTIQTASQPLITSVTTLDITGHNGSSAGLALGGVLITSTADELNYLDTTAGSAQASKALVLDASKNITGINALSATSLTGTLQTAAQPNVTSVGTLTSLGVAGDITIGATVLSEIDLAKIDAITNGVASADKALVLNANKDISGINKVSASVIAIGAPVNSDLPLEVGFKSFQYSGAYAYSNDQNAHGMADAGSGVIANYSIRAEGRIMCQGEIEITSDRRMKKNIIELTPDFSKKFIMTTTPVQFNWKNGDEKTEYGYIAQDVLSAGFNHLVNVTDSPGMEETVDLDGFLSPKDVKYTLSPGKIVPLLALNQRGVLVDLEEKDKKIADLEARLAALEAVFAMMS